MPAAVHKTLADQEIRRADAGMAEIDLAGICLGVGDELLQVLRRKILAQRDDAEGLRDHRDRHEGFRRERQFRIDRVGRGIGAGIADRDGVAVRLGARGARQRGRAAGAGDVLDHDRSGRATLPICSATVRAITSEVPPAANGTIMVIGTLGKILRVGGSARATAPRSRRQPASPRTRFTRPFPDAQRGRRTGRGRRCSP